MNRALALVLALWLAACGGGGAAPPVDPGFPPGTATSHVLVEADPSDLDDIARDTGASVLGPVPGTPYWQVALPPGLTLAQFLALLDDDVRVVDAEADLALDVPEGGASTIPAGTTELAFSISTQSELLRIGLAAARGRASGLGVRVAIVDTGVRASHPYLAGAVDADGWDLVGNDPVPEEETNGLDDDGDGLIDEGMGHGTFIASLIHAVAPAARLVPFRVLNSDGFGTASALAGGITRAADRGVQVVCVSIGMHQQANVVKRAVQYARDRGAVVVASAGNSGQEDVAFPSAYSDALAVTAVAPTDERADFASYGSGVDLCAPGVDLLGAHPQFASGTARWSGTSFSGALVCGGLALLRELFPGLSPGAAQQRLENRSTDVDAVNPLLGGRLGRGRLDLDTATQP